MSQKNRILICDDEPHILHVVSLKLREAGYEVTQAVNGRDALQSALDQPPSLFIVDHNMPGMNGVEFCRALRQHARFADAPIVILTGVDHMIDRAAAAELNIATIIGKPFSPRNLVEQVGQLLESRTPGGVA